MPEHDGQQAADSADRLRLPAPYGADGLVDLLAEPDVAAALKDDSHEWVSWTLTPRQLCDLEMLSNGSFTPLAGFMTRDEYHSVVEDMRLPDGTLWPLPVSLAVTDEVADRLSVGAHVALRDPEGTMLAVLHVRSVFEPDLEAEAAALYGTTDRRYGPVRRLLDATPPIRLGGPVTALQLPNQYDFVPLRRSPHDVRADLRADSDASSVVALHTRSAMHRGIETLTEQVLTQAGARLLLVAAAGDSGPDAIDRYTRIRTYLDVLTQWEPATARVIAVPWAMRFAGPREALLHAIVHRNYGATDVIVGPSHASPGADDSDPDAPPLFGRGQARSLAAEHEDELGVRVVEVPTFVHEDGDDRLVRRDRLDHDGEFDEVSGAVLRQRLEHGEDVPEWLASPVVARELARTYPPRGQRGVTVFLTGLSGSGKSTVANVLRTRLLEVGGRSVTLLDGDLVRQHLSKELGFSREDRNTNVLRIGYVASEITKHGGIAICAPIAPYDAIRKQNRHAIEATGGGYVLVHISTPQEVCEERDRKGLYAKARAGLIKGFTGVDDPYEEPDDADLAIDTSQVSADEAAHQIIDHLVAEGWLGEEFQGTHHR